MARATFRWSTRPAGRLAVPGLLIAVLVGATGAAGAYLIPGSSRALPNTQPSADPSSSSGEASQAPADPSLPTYFPSQSSTGGLREASKLSAWAAPLATKLDIPKTALEAYGYAQWVLEQTQPTCRLSWTTLAAIGKVESDHGRTNGGTLTADGGVYPPLYGDPLNGQQGRSRITDTDHGQLDNDPTYDRAIGPMQFIPSTWQQWETDADNNGMRDPHDIDDASLTAAKYLCAGGRDMSRTADWNAAIHAYNDLGSYVDQVYENANRYGQQSHNG